MTITGEAFKKELKDGNPKLGLFVNSASPTVAEQLAHSGYDWLLVDTQHGPMGPEKLSSMLCAVASPAPTVITTTPTRPKALDSILITVSFNNKCYSVRLYAHY